MRVIVCVDEAGGMSFANRRQSQDRMLRERLLERTAGAKLWMRPYSAKQFDPQQEILAAENYLQLAGEDDWCFVETEDLTPWADRIRRLVVYRWNRRYPADLKFPEQLFSRRWRLESSREFAGFSHETITEEVYSL